MINRIYHGPRRIKGKRGHGAYGKTTVFGIFERDVQVYTEIVSDCSKPALQGIIRRRVDPDTVINSDGWRRYDGLVDLGYGHYRVDHSKDEFVRGRVHINGIEGFWGMAKVQLSKFKGLRKHTFHLHLKETEWLYNHRASDKPNRYHRNRFPFDVIAYVFWLSFLLSLRLLPNLSPLSTMRLTIKSESCLGHGGDIQ